ncbi:acetate--CoA ligase, partial [Staphylococcus chromogenes]
MKVEVYKGEEGNFNLTEYEKIYQDFKWEDVEKALSSSKTGKDNMANECIDRQVDEGKVDNIAFNYKDVVRIESYT